MSSRQLVAIMFTDIVGYTALMGKDSNKALELIRISKEIQKPLVEQHNGKWLKEMGDGAMAQFNSALDAVNCAVAIQKSARAELDAKLRIGIHSGDVTIDNGDVYGDGVNVASRLESITDPGGIYISDNIEKAIRGQSDVQAKLLGEISLKNVDYSVKTYALQGVGLPVPDTKEDKELSGHFKAELKRRGIFRTTLTYLGLGTILYLLLPFANSVIDIPAWFNPAFIVLLIVGLPISVYLSWTYERSPKGYVRTTSEKSWQNPYSAEQRKPMTGNILITGIWVTALILIVYPKLEKSQLADTIPEGDKTIAVIPFNDLSQNQDQ
ncbi:MAG: adenylate/guanylate cyclase domain-containing protein, partial [Bacteroidetes bacterium]|nr:adenylate/guanylate cyclase domain-containing protein [Bacteroidota bacterium]